MLPLQLYPVVILLGCTSLVSGLNAPTYPIQRVNDPKDDLLHPTVIAQLVIDGRKNQQALQGHLKCHSSFCPTSMEPHPVKPLQQWMDRVHRASEQMDQGLKVFQEVLEEEKKRRYEQSRQLPHHLRPLTPQILLLRIFTKNIQRSIPALSSFQKLASIIRTAKGISTDPQSRESLFLQEMVKDDRFKDAKDLLRMGSIPLVEYQQLPADAQLAIALPRLYHGLRGISMVHLINFECSLQAFRGHSPEELATIISKNKDSLSTLKLPPLFGYNIIWDNEDIKLLLDSLDEISRALASGSKECPKDSHIMLKDFPAALEKWLIKMVKAVEVIARDAKGTLSIYENEQSHFH
ncbi:MAG: hypothetical protein DHS80DRAFT_24632 [Piptocephalis tieghemiana]|nr:MAG: hypothetical protein DHS80DRAFT_24632 [Piptocephalis tieghemiana]